MYYCIGLVTAFVALIVYMIAVGLATLGCWLYNKRFASTLYIFGQYDLHAVEFSHADHLPLLRL